MWGALEIYCGCAGEAALWAEFYLKTQTKSTNPKEEYLTQSKKQTDLIKDLQTN